MGRNGRLVYSIGDIEIDPSQHCVRREGQELHLREKVFQVMLHLVENRERVVAKDELIERVWDGAAVSDDVLFRCIMDLRAALGDDSRRSQFIRTVPKVGYRFVAPVAEASRSTEAGPAVQAETAPAWRRNSRRLAGALCAALACVVLATWAFAPRPREGGVQEVGETAWWRLDESSGSTASDSAGAAGKGRIVGSPLRIDGMLGKALRFDGDSHVEGDSRALPLGSAPRTFTAWVRTSTTSGDSTNVFSYGPLGHPLKRGIHLYITDTGRVAFGCGDHDYSVRSDAPVVDGTWHFVAGVYEGPESNIAQIFVDGVIRGWGKLREVPDTSATEWRIGGWHSARTQFRGDIDDVRVYSRALRTPEIQALHRASARIEDAAVPGVGRVYFLPLFFGPRQPDVAILPGASGERSSAVIHPATYYAGVQFAVPTRSCALRSLRGVSVGQEFHLAVDLRTPKPQPDLNTLAGPFFRSRRAAPSDGIIGGTSAGYMVLLRSDGEVIVRLLNPHETVAVSSAPRRFDASVFHRLEVAVGAATLEATLDGALVQFDQRGRQTTAVAIPPAWEGPPRAGENQGTAGIVFLAGERGPAGGQEARNIVVSPYRPLTR